MEYIWMWVGGIIVAAVPSIISGIVMHRVNEHKAEIEERDSEKAEREYLCLESLNAVSILCKELYVCRMLGRTPNGELEEAFKYMQKTKHNLEEYLRQLAAKK